MFDHLFAVFAAWYLAYALMHLDGFMNILEYIRRGALWLYLRGFESPYDALNCVYCLSFWTGLLVSVLLHWGNPGAIAVYALAYAGGATFVDYVHEYYVLGE